MLQYRAVLVRLHQGDSVRNVARARLKGRRKLAASRALAERYDWLVAESPPATDGIVAAVVG